jgi:ABC-2 type transport system ATP-binding protein
VAVSDLTGLTGGLPVRWTPVDEQTAKVWIPRDLNMSEVLSRVVGRTPIRDMSVLEASTDEIVRAIYQSGSAAAPLAADAPGDAAPSERRPESEKTEAFSRG